MQQGKKLRDFGGEGPMSAFQHDGHKLGILKGGEGIVFMGWSARHLVLNNTICRRRSKIEAN
jgi:hypothetical protein